MKTMFFFYFTFFNLMTSTYANGKNKCFLKSKYSAVSVLKINEDKYNFTFSSIFKYTKLANTTNRKKNEFKQTEILPICLSNL